ncbi:hypothetical protein [Cronobacter sakazakii]|uniref:hypothetical protein n=1 Tax=Cronobacter sakazakii TaxID=28141 RepID=UPI001F2B8866|nr:hypothetical protein [Cronobacter sakazakii]
MTMCHFITSFSAPDIDASSAVLLLVGHDIDVVAVVVVLQLVPQDVAVLLEVDALQLDAVHQGVALELHLGAGLVVAVVLEEDGALLDEFTTQASLP